MSKRQSILIYCHVLDLVDLLHWKLVLWSNYHEIFQCHLVQFPWFYSSKNRSVYIFTVTYRHSNMTDVDDIQSFIAAQKKRIEQERSGMSEPNIGHQNVSEK